MTFLDLSPGAVVFAGDSGNDLDVLASDLPAVLVANGHAEVREQALHLARERGHEERLYLARGAFMDFNGNYAAGVLEGVAHYHADLGQWLQEGGP